MQQPKPTIVFVADRIRLSVYAARSNAAPESLAITIERNQSGSDTGWYPTATLRGDDLHAMAKALHELMLTLSTGTNGKAPVLAGPKRPVSTEVAAPDPATTPAVSRVAAQPTSDSGSDDDGIGSNTPADKAAPEKGSDATEESPPANRSKQTRAVKPRAGGSAVRRAAIAKGRSR